MLSVVDEFAAGSAHATCVITPEWLADFERRSNATARRHQAFLQRWRSGQIRNGVIATLATGISALAGAGWLQLTLGAVFVLWLFAALDGAFRLRWYRTQHLQRAQERQAWLPAEVRDRYAVTAIADKHPLISDYLQQVSDAGRALTQGEAQMLLMIALEQEHWLPVETRNWRFTPYHPPLSAEHIRWTQRHYEQQQSNRLRLIGSRLMGMLVLHWGGLVALIGVITAPWSIQSWWPAHEMSLTALLIATSLFASHYLSMPWWARLCRKDAEMASALLPELHFYDEAYKQPTQEWPPVLRTYLDRVQICERPLLVQEWSMVSAFLHDKERRLAMKQPASVHRLH